MSAMTGLTSPVLTRAFRAMASPVTMQVVAPGAGVDGALDEAEAVVREVERTCSRFDPTSALSRANAEPGEWHEVPGTFARAVAEAARAHAETGGLFDPRVHDALVAWGYDRSLPFAEGPVAVAGRGPSEPGAHVPAPRAPWRPQVERDGGRYLVHLDGARIDLGGIGKGLAVRWAAARLADAGVGAMVDAGGDVAVSGSAPDGGPWRVGVEDPMARGEGEHEMPEHELPLLVLAIRDAACATSSTRLRRWRAGGAQVHHLVDPRTGSPGGEGLAAVTVVGPDPAWAEVWSKALFLHGVEQIRDRAERLGLAVAWAGVDGVLGTTAAMDALTLWTRPRTDGAGATEKVTA